MGRWQGSVTLEGRERLPETLHQARRLIDYGWEAQLDVRRLAAASGLSPYHFIRQFRRAFHHTPHQYLVRRRIERAKELLRGGANVTHACFAVGFSSVGSFSAVFRRHAGMSPGEYRATQLREADARRRIPACFLTMCGPDRVAEY